MPLPIEPTASTDQEVVEQETVETEVDNEETPPEGAEPEGEDLDLENIGESELQKALEKASQLDTEEEATTETDGDGGEAQETKSDAEGEEQQETPEGDDKSGEEELSPEQKQEKQLNDTKTAFHNARRQVNELTLENEDLNRQLEEAKTGASQFQKLSAEEEEALKYDDTDKYVEYKMAERAHESKVEQAAAQKEQQENERLGRQQWLNIAEFISQAKGIDLSSVENFWSEEQYPDEFREYVNSEEFGKFKKFAADHFGIDENSTRVLTTENLSSAYKLFNFDKSIAEARAEGGDKAVDAIKNAANNGSRLDKTSRDRGSTQHRKASDLAQSDIAPMGEAELDEAIAKMKEEGEWIG